MNPEARVKREAFEGFGFSLEGVLSCVALKKGGKKYLREDARRGRR